MWDGYVFQDPDGREMTVSQMSTSDVSEIVSGRCGLEAMGGESKPNVMERLRIELVIRQLGLAG